MGVHGEDLQRGRERRDTMMEEGERSGQRVAETRWRGPGWYKGTCLGRCVGGELTVCVGRPGEGAGVSGG